MRVFLAGATGVLGRRLVDQFADRGHEVVGLVRDDDGAALVETRGGTPQYGDVLDPETLAPAMAGADVVVAAQTALPVKDKPTEADWARNDRVRVEGTRNLVATADDTVDRFCFPSVVWVARQPDGSRFDERAERHPDRATRSAADVEDLLQDAASEHGFDVTILRLGFLYAPDAGHTRQMGEGLLSRDLPIVGGGLLGRRDAELSLLHADDAARAFVEAIGADATGLYHVVDDEPVSVADFFSAFAAELGAPKPRRVPGWLARFLVGREQVNVLTKPFPTTATLFRRDVGWEPSYPTYREGLAQVVGRWADDGTIRRTGTGYEWVGHETARQPNAAEAAPRT
ncbi:NAD(P)-dependent oxidoreductase [Halorarum halophilum]|uniref:NAD(P)-dependent oxidoreductase n=1 Tax=Halorarum halophilum TaxID=2743090 RepID=A0A7D5K9D9_9EURY|nr:NAD(P)-dependent oxidoreductase [Halobaculum halophilum]QLG28994.1 NAD(P)-dependent oxidoreductase [Halobaculum halophilum]